MMYSKHLNSVEALQAERAKLKKRAKKASRKFKTVEKSGEENDTLTKLAAFAAGSFAGKSVPAFALETAVKWVAPHLLKRGAQLGVRRIVVSTLKDVALGYAKWKALAMAAKFVAKKVKQKTEKEA